MLALAGNSPLLALCFWPQLSPRRVGAVFATPPCAWSSWAGRSAGRRATRLGGPSADGWRGCIDAPAAESTLRDLPDNGAAERWMTLSDRVKSNMEFVLEPGASKRRRSREPTPDRRTTLASSRSRPRHVGRASQRGTPGLRERTRHQRVAGTGLNGTVKNVATLLLRHHCFCIEHASLLLQRVLWSHNHRSRR